MQSPPSVYLVDDQAIVRASFKALLSEDDRFQVVGQQGDARTGISEIRKLKPDVVLLDISMPGLSGLEALPQIVAAIPDGYVVMVTDFETEDYVLAALAAGARGYLSKADEPADLLSGLSRIIAGERYVSPRIRGFGAR
jgi:DNA-binding NarL/FixJ family response regulator